MELRRRLTIEYNEARRCSDKFVQLYPNEMNMKEWEAILKGPAETPYEGGNFKMKITCPDDYPIRAPTVVFVTPVFHPNINFDTGEICVDVLKKEWTPRWSIYTFCLAILSLLKDPNADSPLNCDAGNLIRWGDIRAYESLARYLTNLHAMTQKTKP
eukprot:GHVP01043950.1.p1 GENE.GHVP01043950.1~~GHVP01043950.1.p1  ORF type:complete len:157 (+),score=26.57 GHVP01043950.1:529-999(+)